MTLHVSESEDEEEEEEDEDDEIGRSAFTLSEAFLKFKRNHFYV